jgi:hypothetical protein
MNSCRITTINPYAMNDSELYISESRLKRCPHLVITRYRNGTSPRTERFILSNKAEPVYYPQYNMLNVVGSYIVTPRKTPEGIVKYSVTFPNLDFSENFYACANDSIIFVDNCYILKHTFSYNDCDDYYGKFREFSKKLVLHVTNEMTRRAIDSL